MDGLVRDIPTATRRLAPGMQAARSGQSFESFITSEAEVWAAGGSDTASVSSIGLSSVHSGGGNHHHNSGSNHQHQGGSSAEGLALRQSSGGGAAPAAVAGGGAVEPSVVVQHATLRGEWQRRIGAKERVSWREFWYKLVQPQVRRVWVWVWFGLPGGA